MNKIKLLYVCFKNFYLRIYTGIQDNIILINKVLIVVFPVIYAIAYDKDIKFAITNSTFSFILFVIMKISDITKNLENGFPRMKRRIVKKRLDGEYYIEPSDIKIAIMYLKEVEDFAERNGFL